MLTLIFKPLSLLSLSQLHRLGRLLGNLLFLIAPPIRLQIQQNLQQSGLCNNQQDLLQMVRCNMQETGKSLLESFALWQKPQQELLRWVQHCHDWQLVEQAQQQGRGIIFLTAHQGCFEITSIYYGSQHPITVLYRPPKLRWLSGLIEIGRKQPGVSLAPANRKGVRLLLQALQRGEAIGILPDQTPTKAEGEWADFFGKPAYTMTLVSKLARKSNAQVIMAFGERLADSQGFKIHLRALDSTQVSTPALLNQAIEQQIRQCPSQYYWAYDRYKASRKALKKLAVDDCQTKP